MLLNSQHIRFAPQADVVKTCPFSAGQDVLETKTKVKFLLSMMPAVVDASVMPSIQAKQAGI